MSGITEQIRIIYKIVNRISGEIKPGYVWVTSHLPSLFFNKECLHGTPTNLVMVISGFKTEKAVRIYIKVDQAQKVHIIKKLCDSKPGL